jgi:hypothetical protein
LHIFFSSTASWTEIIISSFTLHNSKFDIVFG